MLNNQAITLISLHDEYATGVRYLASYLEEHGYEAYIIFLKRYVTRPRETTEKEFRLLVDLVKKINSKFVGISVRSFYRDLARKVTEMIREECGNVIIIWGNVHATIDPDDCIQYADIVCRGEGEETILELMEKVKNGEDIRTIKGLWIKEKGKVYKNDLRPLINDLNSLPHPSFERKNTWLIDDDQCIMLDMPNTVVYQTMTSRGCPYICSYCIVPLLKEIFKGKGKFLRRRSPDNVIEELRYIKRRFGIKFVDFEDEEFLWDKKWLQGFLPKYRRYVGLPFVCLASPNNSKDESIIRLLNQCGLRLLTIGIQTGSERILKEVYQRFTSRESILRASMLTRKYSILPTYDIILDNPWEKEGDLMETINLLLSLCRPFMLNLFSLTFFPNYVITKKAIQEGIISKIQVKYTKFEAEVGKERYACDNVLYNILYLTQVDYIPKTILRFLVKSRFIRKHPSITKNLVKLTLKFGNLKDTYIDRIIHNKWDAKSSLIYALLFKILPHVMR